MFRTYFFMVWYSSPIFIGMIKSKKMYGRAFIFMEEMRNVYTVLLVKPAGKRGKKGRHLFCWML
jgi:hypothetical protein